nr:hypothetical protein [Tanacetum cinerariifolium]
MVNTRTDANLSATVQNALQGLLPQIRAEIHEEFRTSFGPSNAGGNPPPVTIHTWHKRFNKQKPHSFEKATAPGMLRIKSLTWKRSSMLWVVKMLLRRDWLYISLREVAHSRDYCARIMDYFQSQEVHTSTLVTQMEALRREVSTIHRQNIEHAQRNIAPEDGDSCS